jgi:hypothetical protein
MAKKTYTQINSVTLAAASSSVSFDSIPQNFRDLIIVSTSRTAITSSGYANLRFNSDSGNNYSELWIQPGGAGSFSSGADFGYFGSFSQNVIQIFDYSSTDKHKIILHRPDTIAVDLLQMRVGRWASNSAVSTIRLGTSAGNYATGSTFTLYGIEA